MEEVWKSYRWPDGTFYEGLAVRGRPNSYGVIQFPNKDRYEGQFHNGAMDGFGVYVWSDGTIYRGEWMQGRMHGCGVKLWKQRGGAIQAVEGKFLGDEYVGPIMPCAKDDAFDAAVEADVAASQARSFLVHSLPKQVPAQRGPQRHLPGHSRATGGTEVLPQREGSSVRTPPPAINLNQSQQTASAGGPWDEKLGGFLHRLLSQEATKLRDVPNR